LEKSVQIVPMNATVNDLVEAAAIAAYDAVTD
jgi:phosphotransacetylase